MLKEMFLDSTFDLDSAWGKRSSGRISRVNDERVKTLPRHNVPDFYSRLRAAECAVQAQGAALFQRRQHL